MVEIQNAFKPFSIKKESDPIRTAVSFRANPMFITPYGAKENAAAGMMMEVVQQDAGIILIVRKLPSFGVWIDEKYEKMNLMDRFLRSCAYENIH